MTFYQFCHLFQVRGEERRTLAEFLAFYRARKTIKALCEEPTQSEQEL